MSATTKAILVLARGLAVITQKGCKQIDHKEVGPGGKQQRKGRADENALTAHVMIIAQDTHDPSIEHICYVWSLSPPNWTAFKALPLENFRIVHLAVHGIANAQFPDRAALILGTSPTSTDDGLLQVREIRDLALRADLVVLSACETGSGKLLGEEGIASLERAFLLAGESSTSIFK